MRAQRRACGQQSGQTNRRRKQQANRPGPRRKHARDSGGRAACCIARTDRHAIGPVEIPISVDLIRRNQTGQRPTSHSNRLENDVQRSDVGRVAKSARRAIDHPLRARAQLQPEPLAHLLPARLSRHEAHRLGRRQRSGQREVRPLVVVVAPAIVSPSCCSESAPWPSFSRTGPHSPPSPTAAA